MHVRNEVTLVWGSVKLTPTIKNYYTLHLPTEKQSKLEGFYIQKKSMHPHCLALGNYEGQCSFSFQQLSGDFFHATGLSDIYNLSSSLAVRTVLEFTSGPSRILSAVCFCLFLVARLQRLVS